MTGWRCRPTRVVERQAGLAAHHVAIHPQQRVPGLGFALWQVDLIDSVPPTDAVELGRNDQVKTVQQRHQPDHLPGAGYGEGRGRPSSPPGMARSYRTIPCGNVRVRQALSEMVNRDVIVTRLLSGAAVPAGQIVPEGEGGYTVDLKPSPFDPKAAKALLEQAGYPQGFALTLHSSADRYPSDGQVIQAVGQMFSRGGLQVTGVEALPYNVFAPRSDGSQIQRVPVWLEQCHRRFVGGAPPPSSPPPILRTGWARSNRTRYSNPQFDAKLAHASARVR